MAMAKQMKVYLIKLIAISFEPYEIPLLTNHIWWKTFLYIVSNEDEEEGDSSQTTVAVILVIAWCLVAIIAFFYYKQTKTGIKNDILFLDYDHKWVELFHMICQSCDPSLYLLFHRICEGIKGRGKSESYNPKWDWRRQEWRRSTGGSRAGMQFGLRHHLYGKHHIRQNLSKSIRPNWSI